MRIETSGKRVLLFGDLDERAPDASLRQAIKLASGASATGEVEVDFSGIDRANSIGIGVWARTFKAAACPITYVNAPEWLVSSFTMVDDLVLGDVVVESLMLNFVNFAGGPLKKKAINVRREVPLDEEDPELRFVDENGQEYVCETSLADFLVILRDNPNLIKERKK